MYCYIGQTIYSDYVILGLPVKPLVYVRRVYVPLEQQFKYLSDESSSEDEEWTEGPIKKKDDPTASKGK